MEEGSCSSCESSDWGPVLNLNYENANTYSWKNLPSQIFKKIFSYMNDASVKEVRKVCTNWRDEIDLECGLKIKTDDRIPETIQFAKKVKVNQLRIVQLLDFENFRCYHVGDVQRLIICGPIAMSWINNEISGFSLLTKLVLRGTSLHSGNLFSTASSQAKNFTLNFTALKSLELIINETSLPLPLPLSIRLSNPGRNALNEEDHVEKATTGAKNISNFLSSAMSPCLSHVQVYSYQRAGYFLSPAYNWKYRPLKIFLETHKDTLREIYLPEYEGSDSGNDFGMYPCPRKLTKILIDLTRYGTHDDIDFISYWKQLLMSQETLKYFKICLIEMTNSWINDTLLGLCHSSSQTLCFVDLTLHCQDVLNIDGTMFSKCVSLEVLQIICVEHEVIFTNAIELPHNLRKLRLSGCLVDFDAPPRVNKFKHLDMLDLTVLIINRHNYDCAVEAVKRFLLLRKLNFINIVFSESVDNNETFRLIVDHFSSLWDPRFPYRGIKLNLDYELEEGWNDDVFDEELNDRHYINQQEPEELAVWFSMSNTYDEEMTPNNYVYSTLPFYQDAEGTQDSNYEMQSSNSQHHEFIQEESSHSGFSDLTE